MEAATEKRCSNCNRTLPIEAFYREASRADGRQSRCKECHRETRKPHERSRWLKRRARLDTYKREQGCVDCGATEFLDFDHRPDEEKLFVIGSRWSYSWEVLWAEIAKCDVRCRSCHSRRHALAGDTVPCH